MLQKTIIFFLRFYLNTINLISKKIGGKHAFLLFCYPIPVKLKPAQQEFLDTSTRTDTRFEGKKIATYTWGSGPKAILCLHGWQSQTFRWKKFIETFDKEKYTIVSVDAPAHGNSQGTQCNVPMYAQLIEQLIKDKNVTYILAHSLGAFSTMCLFYEKPELSVEKVALLGTPGEAMDFVDEYVRILGTSSRVKTNLLAYFKSYANTEPSYYSAIRFATKQKSDALIIHDVDDKEAPYHYAEKIHSLWSNSGLYTTQGLGHKLRSIEVVNKVVGFF